MTVAIESIEVVVLDPAQGGVYPFAFDWRGGDQLALTLFDSSGALDDLPLEHGTDWTATPAGRATGGEATLLADPGAYDRLLIRRATTVAQEFDAPPTAAGFEAALDRVVMQQQEREGEFLGAVRAPLGLSGLRLPAWRPGALLGWRADAALLEAKDPAAGGLPTTDGVLDESAGGTGDTSLRGALARLGREVWVEAHGALGYPPGTPTTEMADSGPAFRAAIAAAGVGGVVRWRPGRWYRSTLSLRQLDYQHWIGAGTKARMEGGELPGTLIVFDGTGAKEIAFPVAVGAQAESGGSVANPAAALSYLDSSGARGDVFTLHDFTNGDASGATPATAKAFSAAVRLGRFGKCDGVHIINDKAGDLAEWQTADGNAGDVWDVGFLSWNADNFALVDCSTLGHFRIAGLLIAAVPSGDPDDGFNGVPIANQNTILNCTLMGQVGWMMRSPDLYRVTAVTAAYVEVAWSASHMWPASGTVAKAAAGATSYAYTAVAAVGDRLRLSTSADLTAVFSVGDEVMDGRNNPNYGFDGTRVVLGRVNGPFTRQYLTTDDLYGLPPGKCIEVSGFPLRGVEFVGVTIDTNQDVMVHMHNAGDVKFVASNYEGKGAERSDPAGSIAAGAFWIGRSRGANASAYPAGGTGAVWFIGSEPQFRTITRAGGYTQSSDVAHRHSGAGGSLFAPDPLYDDYRHIYGSAAFGHAIRYRGGVLAFLDNDLNVTRWRIDAGGHLVPAAAGAYDIGSASARVDQVFLQMVMARPYLVSELPLPGEATNAIVYVADGDGGSPCLAVSAGGAWRRIALGASIPLS